MSPSTSNRTALRIRAKRPILGGIELFAGIVPANLYRYEFWLQKWTDVRDFSRHHLDTHGGHFYLRSLMCGFRTGR